MHLGIKGKQVLGVTSIVGVVVVVLSLLHLAQLAKVILEESKTQAELLAYAIYQTAATVVQPGGDPHEALRNDQGTRSILESTLYSKQVIYAAIVDLNGIAFAHVDRSLEGQPLPANEELTTVLQRSSLSQLVAIYSGPGRTLEHRQPLIMADKEFGSIRIGVSTLLLRTELDQSLGKAAATATISLAIAVLVAMLLAQLLLRPIHVIRSGLTRLGRGELGVRLDLDQADEFGELGTFFNTVSAQLSADRSQMAGQVASLESAVGHLEDAIAITSPAGDVMFVNPAMRALMPNASPGAALSECLEASHPLRRLLEQTQVSGQSRGPVSAAFPPTDGSPRPSPAGTVSREEETKKGSEPVERLLMSHAVTDKAGALVGIMLVARNLEYLSQVQSTIRYSRKLAALGRLSAGVAHEVKNPLNAMMIHLELLRQKFGVLASAHRRSESAAGRAEADDGARTTANGRGGGVSVAAPAAPEAGGDEVMEHVDVIAREIRRLDEVVQGFLKFSRPEDLTLQPVGPRALVDEVAAIVKPEANRAGVGVVVESDGVPDVNGDPAMLRQAFLNLALNACQAMPNGGTLRIRCETARGRQVSVSFIDTGVGIAPDHLQRIFDLYFSTKKTGNGIGLSMVYRTVQMHDGEIEVQSTPGAGTTFRVLLPQV